MEDEGRQKKVEVGREKFAAYLKKKNALGQKSEQKKKKKVENDVESPKEVSVAEESLDSSPLASSLEDIEGKKQDIPAKTQGTTVALDEDKQSFEEGGDMSRERLQTRVKELEDILSGKDAALEAAHEELCALKGITSFDVSTGMLGTDFKIHLEEYHKRLLEFQEAVEHREGIISQLSSSLQQAIVTRDALQVQGDQLAQEVAVLQHQLKATTELIQGHHWDTGINPHDYVTLQNQVLALEVACKKSESVMADLNSVIKEKTSELQCKSDDLEKKSQELIQHKTKSANEIQKLMREVEMLHQKCAITASNQNSLILEHEGQMAALQAELEENFGLQLAHIKEELRNQFNAEKAALEQRLVEEMTLASQSSSAERDLTAEGKHQLESLYSQLQESSEAREKLETEIAQLKQSSLLDVDMYKQNIAVLQQQLEVACKEKLIYEQESRNSFEKELSLYKQQIENLNFRLQEASKAEIKYSEQLDEGKKVLETELLSLKQFHEMELSVFKEQIDNVKLQLQEVSRTSANYCSQLADCKKTYKAKLECVQQSHEMELASYRQRIEALNLRLQELPEGEENIAKVLAAHKQHFESEVCGSKEENEIQRILVGEDTLRNEKSEILESHSVTVLSYEEQLVHLKSLLQTAEEAVENHKRDVSSLKRQLEDSSNANEIGMKELKSCKAEIVTLKTQLEDALKTGDIFKQDFAACKRAYEEEINLMKEKYESEWTEKVAIAKCQSYETELVLCKQQIEFLNSRLRDASEAEKCHVLEITACQAQLTEYKVQVDSLDSRFNEELIHAEENLSKEINSKNQEIETLLASLQEVTALDEKYKNQMLSAQQEIDSLKKQLNERAEIEKKNIIEIASCQEKLMVYMDEVQTLKALSASQDELQAYKQQVETFKERLHYELLQLQDSHDAQLKIIEAEHAVCIASFNKQVDDLTVQITEQTKANKKLEQDKSVFHESHTLEIDKYKHQLDELNISLQKYRVNEETHVTALSDCQVELNTYKSQVQLLNAKVQNDMSQMKVLHTKEVNDLRDELQHLKNVKTTLEAEVLCLNEAVKHRDNCSKSQLEEATVQFLKAQSLLAAKEEVEKAYERRINDLQIDLDKANQSVAQMTRESDQLHEINVQHLKLQGLLAAKEEAECILIEHVTELEQALCTATKDLEKIKHEGTQITQNVVRKQELLKKLKFEKDEVLEKYKHLEAEREKLMAEKEANEEKLKELESQILKLKSSSTVGESGSSDLSAVSETCTGVVVTQLEHAGLADSSAISSQVIVSAIDNALGENYSGSGAQISASGPLKRRKLYTVKVPEPVVSLCPTKWMERLIVLEREKKDLASQLGTLELKFKEKELQECLYNEETHAAKLYCKELEEKLQQLENVRIERDVIHQKRCVLESKIVELQHENATFQKLQKALNIELTEEKMTNEDKLHEVIKERLGSIVDENGFSTVENLIHELGHTAKEIVCLKEILRSQEQTCQLLHEKILALEKSKAEDAKRMNLCSEELAKAYSELEESWKQLKATKEELGMSKKELAILCLQKQQLESSNSRLLHMSTSPAEITPVYASSQQDLYNMLEDLSIEVGALKNLLKAEQDHNEKLSLELEGVRKGGPVAHLGLRDMNCNDSSGNGMLEVQHKLELVLKSNAELVAETETLLVKLRNQQQCIGKLQQAGGYEQVDNWMSILDRQQDALMAELRAYREQHKGLAELVGSTGILQETLFRQKQELLQKFEEKSIVEKKLESERAELKSAQFKIQMLENQVIEKDKMFQELTWQKQLLEQDLHEIEDRLRDQEDRLQTQKLALEAEIRDRDQRIQHCQLELRAKQVEVNCEKTLKELDRQSTQSATDSNQNGEQERLELFRSQLEEVHQQAVGRLKLHMEERIAVREMELQKNFASEVSTLQQQHKEQLSGIQQQLDAKVKELQAFMDSELLNQLGISQDMFMKLEADKMALIKEKQRTELEDMKKCLDEQETKIYRVLKEKFEKFAEQQIAIALKIIQDERDTTYHQTVSGLIVNHSAEVKALQAKLESQRHEELMLLRQNLNKKYNDELNEITRGLKLEISLLKQSHNAKSERSSVQQLKQEMCMEYSSTLKGWIQTWYSDCQEQLGALNKQIYKAWQQEESVCQGVDSDTPAKTSVTPVDIRSLLESKQLLLSQAEVLHTEVAKRHMQALHDLHTQLNAEHSKLVEKVEQMKKTVQEGTTVACLQDQISKLVAEKEQLQDKHRLAVDTLSHEHSVEVAKLRELIANVKCENISGLTELRQKMETKHAKEMEELRQYFEKKCADVEKRYSEEVFNQHSRKMSGSSSGLENELVSDMYYVGGDDVKRLAALTHICDSYSVEPSFKDLEERYQAEYERRLLEYRDQLEGVKLELEEKYQKEMEVLREEYKSKVEDIVKDLSNDHKTELQNMELKHAKEIQNLKEKLQLESARELSNVRLESLNEVEKVRIEMADEHRRELEDLRCVFEVELKKQIENLAFRMKQQEEEHCAAMKSELLSKHVKDCQKLESSFDDQIETGTEAMSQQVDLEHKIQLDVKQHCEEEYKRKLTEMRNEMRDKHAKELETRTEAERKLMTEQFDKMTTMLKNIAEEEQDKLMAHHKEVMFNFVKQHQQDLQGLKMQYEAYVQAIQEECAVQVQKLKAKHKQEIAALQDKAARHTLFVATSGVSVDQTDGAGELNLATTEEIARLQTIQQLQDEIIGQDVKFASAVSEVRETCESELQTRRTCCEGQLHDRVEHTGHDITRARDEQTQALQPSGCADSSCPRELLELQEKFAVQYKQQLAVLKEECAKKMTQLKNDYEAQLKSFEEKFSQDKSVAAETAELKLEKAGLAMQIKLGDTSQSDITDTEQLIRERDSLRKMTGTLRHLLRELVAYFTACEDELNNTLIGELLRVKPEASENIGELSKNILEANGQSLLSVNENTFHKSDVNIEAKNDSSMTENGETVSVEYAVTSPEEIETLMAQDHITCDEVSLASHHFVQSPVPVNSSAHGTHRVHFAPDASSIISLIDEDNLLDYVQTNRDLSVDFRSELGNCLERLKAEALTVLGLSSSVPKAVHITRDAVMLLEEKVNILTHRLEVEVKGKDDLLRQLESAEGKERECTLLRENLENLKTVKEGLESDLQAARTRVMELELELVKREDVTEGFGESIQPGLIRGLTNLAHLQDKARSVLSERTLGDHKSPYLQLIEELCREGDRLLEESRKERDDLQQQVEVADKQLRATHLFLEEQAAEREQERDDFLQEITKLQEQVREHDHERIERERLAKEVEALELQVKDAASLQKDFNLKKEELEMELKAAVDKIWVLRDIIGELESQLEVKTQHEVTLQQQLQDLQVILEQQSKTHQELTEELDSLRLDSGKSQLTEHIRHLEEQLRKHRLHVEQFQSNSTAVQQMKAQLRDLQATVDKKTKDLELFHTTVSSASCSSPSEDVSIREQLDAFRCDTPEERRNTLSPVSLPLDELHRLQDKLQHHSRAEEVALKRVRDLEMQLKRVKKNEEEVAAERDVLQERVEQQLLRISALQSRLDEQRQKDDRQLKEANLELQTKISDQDQEIATLHEKIESKEQEVKELKATLQESRRIMETHEKEWHKKTNEELEMIKNLRETCQRLRAEKSTLERNSRDLTSGLRDEMRHHTADTTHGILTLDKDDVLYTSKRDFVSSGSEKDFEDKNVETMLIKKDREIVSLKNQLAASAVQMDELQRLQHTNIELMAETAELQKDIETLKEKTSELIAENHSLKVDLNRLPGTPDELAGQVQKELDILNQMDTIIMEQLSTGKPDISEDIACTSLLPSPVLSHLLNKALQEGIGALRLNEFSFIHQEICRAAYARTMQDSATQVESETASPSDASNSHQLLVARIAALESEIVCRQQESVHRILDLEENVCQENKRVLEVQEILNQEQKLRMELQNRVELQSQSFADLEEQRDILQRKCSNQENQLQQYVIKLEEERSRTNQLQIDLQRGQITIKDLQAVLEDERRHARDAKLMDAALIEDLRIKLDRVLDKETRRQLQVEQVKRAQDSIYWKGTPQKVCACTQTTCPSLQTPSFYKDKLEFEQKKSARLELELQKEKQRGEELVTAVEKEKQLGQQKLAIEKEIIQELKRELLIVDGQRDSLNTQLIHVRKQLSLSHVEVDALERRVHVLQKSEAQRKRSRQLEQEEMDINRRELQKFQSLQFDQEQKVIDLEQEVSRLKQELLERKAQMVATGHEQDTARLRQEVEKLKQDLQNSRVRELQLSRELSSSPKVQSPVLEKLKNVNMMLEQHVTENAEVALTLSRLTEERQQLQSQVKELEEQLKIAAKSQAADQTDSVHVAFAAERALWAQEKAALKLALAQAEADAFHGCRIGDDTDTSDRIKQLFWKYQRSESYRKALIWQKKYLLLVLGGYEEAEAITLSRLAQLSGVQESMLYRQQSVPQKKPRARFKTAAVVIIALSRMRYLVRRWQSRRHIGSSAVLTRGLSESTLSSFHGPRRRGSSTSGNSSRIPRAPAQGYGPFSPPSRDQVIMHRSTESGPVSVLRSSQVAEFVDRFDELQRRLGLSLTTSPP